jgi:hypothetical protein
MLSRWRVDDVLLSLTHDFELQGWHIFKEALLDASRCNTLPAATSTYRCQFENLDRYMLKAGPN